MMLTMHPNRNPGRARRSVPAAVLAAILLAGSASPAFAYRPEEEHEIVDARLEGYGNNVNVTLPSSSSGTTWVLFIILAIVASVGLFKDARRSHLD
jgi:hypothetical protein